MTEIKLYNTRTRKKAPFEPIDPTDVRMYVCGPTVYDRAHIGNARPVVVFDVLFRLLRHVYGEGAVTYARNFTDVDDRIINRAVETKGAGETLEAACRRITDETIGWYHEDMGALGALRPTKEPRCTEYIPQMVEMTEKLIAGGHAYEAEGHVLFDVATYKNYGKLSRRSLDDMVAGSRVEVAPYKRSPMDFVIWKPSTPEQPGWPSPWGRGRPGWHIECSAMADAILTKDLPPQKKVFDIHGGGIDLAFPHHENEVAQSCCAHGTNKMANVWMHNGFLQIEGKKMAKSLGNFFTVKDLLDEGVPGEVIRFVLLSTKYTEPLDWTRRSVDEAYKTLVRWGEVVRDEPSGEVPQEFIDALADDLNTARAFAVLHKLAKNGRASELHAATKFIGIGLIFKVEATLTLSRRIEEPRAVEVTAKIKITTKFHATMKVIRAKDSNKTDWELKIERLIALRSECRKSKNFGKADKIRDDLAQAGVEIKDTKNGQSWEISTYWFHDNFRRASLSNDKQAVVEARMTAKEAGLSFGEASSHPVARVDETAFKSFVQHNVALLFEKWMDNDP